MVKIQQQIQSAISNHRGQPRQILLGRAECSALAIWSKTAGYSGGTLTRVQGVDIVKVARDSHLEVKS